MEKHGKTVPNPLKGVEKVIDTPCLGLSRGRNGHVEARRVKGQLREARGGFRLAARREEKVGRPPKNAASAAVFAAVFEEKRCFSEPERASNGFQSPFLEAVCASKAKAPDDH